MLRHLFTHLLLLFGAAHLGQHQGFSFFGNVPGHHHLLRSGNSLQLHAGQRQQCGAGRHRFKIGSYWRRRGKG